MLEHQDEHYEHLARMWDDALEQAELDAAWIVAGEATLFFRDDQGPHFKANAMLGQWVPPEYTNPGTRLLVRRGRKAKLYLPRQADYWHSVAPVPDQLASFLDIEVFATLSELADATTGALPPGTRCALLGAEMPADHGSNEQQVAHNPAGLLNYLDFHRAQKTAFELQMMRNASDVGVKGHLAAAEAFRQGQSEFDIHMAYLAASQQSELDLPYGNIVGLNEHAGILHYQHQDRHRPKQHRSLLIDAGGGYAGYASDITRSYSAEGEAHSRFNALLNAMQQHQDKLLHTIRPGLSFADLHDTMHQQLAELLVDQQLVTCSAAHAYEQGITRAFCPHGLGHLLGLQVHDVGGHLGDPHGTAAPPAEHYPTLRFTREIQPDYVFTIEPGIYFMPYFLGRLRQDKAPIQWTHVDELTPYGGIRIEDNVRVLDQGIENLTRDAFARVEAL